MKDKGLYLGILLLALVATFSLTACISPAEPPQQPQPAAEIMPLEDLEEWDLLWISDSSGWDVADVYAGMVAEDTGKIINVHDKWLGGLPAALVYQALTGAYDGPSLTLEQLPELVSEAEIIVFYANPSESINESRPGDWECISGHGSYVNDCDPEIFTTYLDHLDTIYQRVFELRAGQPTIILSYDAYNPRINLLRENGVYEECKQCWGYYNDAIHLAAAKFNIPVACISESWNGPGWDIDPNDLGYTKDGEHPNELGIEVIAQALRELGYDPVLP
jgi:hypothetical protein